MPEIFWVATVLIVVLFLMAAIGHGIWLLASKIVRWLFGGQSAHRARHPLSPTTTRDFIPLLQRDKDVASELAQLRQKIESLHERGVFHTTQLCELRAIVDSAAKRVETSIGEPATTVHAAPATPEEPILVAELAEATPVDTTDEARTHEASGPTSNRDEVVLEPDDVAAAACTIVADASVNEASTDIAASQVHPLDRADVPVDVQRPRHSVRQRMAFLVQGFMEERNIRWGEIIAGILIVGSAIGLVVSLWKPLRESIPYFPALIFMGFTAAIHAAGVYTLQRWKLQSTSRGMLLISLVLVPLNFLAAISLERSSENPLWLVATAVVVGLVGFGAITISACRLLVPGKWYPLAIAVLVPSVSQVLISRTVTAEMPRMRLLMIGAIPVSAFVWTCLWQIREAAGWCWTHARCRRVFVLVSLGLYSVVAALVLLVGFHGNVVETIQQISPVLCCSTLPLLGLGLLIQRDCVSRYLAPARIAGIAIGILGAVSPFLVLGLVMEDPLSVSEVALGSFLLLSLFSVIGAEGRLHLLAVPLATIGCLAAFAAIRIETVGPLLSESGWIAQVVTDGYSSLLLLCMAILTFLAAYAFQRANDLASASSYRICATVIVTVAAAIALIAGVTSSSGAAVAAGVLVIALLSLCPPWSPVFSKTIPEAHWREVCSCWLRYLKQRLSIP